MGVFGQAPLLGVEGVATGDGRGVYGYSSGAQGFGVYGFADGAYGRGVAGITSSNSGNAISVYGYNSTGYGVGVWGEAGTGVRGQGGLTGVYGYGSVSGVEGIGSGCCGIGVRGEGLPGIEAVSKSASTYAAIVYSYGGSTTNPGLYVSGSLFATGNKSAIVPYDDDVDVQVYSEESAEVWFSDYGITRLRNGVAKVVMDEGWLRTVNTRDGRYHVFVTPRGKPQGTLFVTAMTPSTFEIRETSGLSEIDVSFRVVAKRKGFELERLKRSSRKARPKQSAGAVAQAKFPAPVDTALRRPPRTDGKAE